MKIFNNISLKLKMTMLVGLLIVAIIAGAASTFLKLSSFSHTAEETYKNEFAGLKYVANIQLLVEQQFGIVKGAPALLDLEILQQIKSAYETNQMIISASLTEFEAALENDTSISENIAQLTEKMVILNEAAQTIFKQVSQFSQDAASDTLKNSFLPAANTLSKELSALQSSFDQGASQNISNLVENSQNFMWLYLTISVCMIAILAAFSFIIIKGMSGRISQLTKQMKSVAEGDHDIEIRFQNSGDEIGAMAKALQIFKINVIERLELEKHQEEQRSKAELDKKQAMQDLATTFEERINHIVQKVAASSQNLKQTSSDMVNVVETSGEMAYSAVQDASKTSQDVQAVASAAEEMSATVNEITSQVQKTNELVGQSVEKVSVADVRAQALSDASIKIQDVIQLIADIANQISLLALNATIESARAGEAGRGFAVVANEVKNLANQTDKSVQDIRIVIEDMNNASGDIVTSLSDIKEAVNSISEVSSSVAASVEEQSAATQEIASNMASASSSTQGLSTNLSTIHTSSEQSKDASHQVLSEAQSLSHQTDSLDEEINKFLQEIRA